MKRNNELVTKIEEIANLDVLTEEQKKDVRKLIQEYEWATYKEYSDRHKFYRDMVSKMINDFGFEDEELAKAMAREHPTLQQNFMRMVTMFLEEMANKTYYDDRNKASVELAKKLKPIIEEHRGMPYI